MANPFLEKRAAKAAEEANAKAEAEKAEAEKIANAVAESTAHRQNIHDRVREALRIPANHFDTLNKMVAENRVKVGAAVSVVESDASEANDEILKEGLESDEKLSDYKAFLQDVNEAKRAQIKSATIEGLKAKRDESKTSLAQNRVSSKLNNQFDKLTDEEVSAIDAAHESGDVAALKAVNKAVEERLVAAKNVEAREVFSRIPKLQKELELPMSPYQNLLKTGYELKSIQEDLRKLNNEGQDLVDTLKKAGLDMGAIRKDPKIQEIAGSINKIKSVEQSTKDLYIKEKDRLAKEAEHNAPKNAEEFQKRTEDLGVKYKQLNSEFGQEFLVSTEKLSTLMKKLREDNPEFQYWKTPRYVELARDSSGVSNTEMRAIERKTEQDFTAFAFDKIQKDPELVKFFENSAKRSNQYIGAVAGLEEERKGLQNLMSPKRVGWLKDDASVTAKMWGLVVDNPSFHTIDAAREGGQVSHRMVMERFGLMRGSDFKPTV
jgi:hypothetical protein